MLTPQTTFLKKSTSETVMLFARPTEPILTLVKRFIQNTEWTYDLLGLIDALLHGKSEITGFQRLIVEDYLSFSLAFTGGKWVLKDRQNQPIETLELIYLRNQIHRLTEQHSISLANQPGLHPMKKAFKQVLTKIGYKKLSDEDKAILRDAYLIEKKGQLFTLSGRMVALPHFTKRILWKLIA